MIGIICLTLFFFLPVSALAAELPSPELSGVSVSDSSCKIKWKTVEGAQGYNVYLREESGKYTKLNDKPVTDNHVRLVSLINGVPYYFAVTSVSDDEAESPASLTGMVVPTGQATQIIPFKGGARAADYRIFSMPFTTERNRPKDVFAYFPSYDKRMWRIFALARDGYREFHDIAAIEPGKAYWLLSRYDTELFLSGRTVNNYDPFFVQLHPGWNVIGSPFLYTVEWDEVLNRNPDYARFISPVLWQFSSGGFVRAATVEPFEGYYVYNSFGGDVDLLIPPVPMTPRIYDELTASPVSYSGSSTAGGGGWLMKISAEDGIYHDTDNLIGVNVSADDGPDRLDMAEPPAWPQHLSLYFISDEATAPRLASDIRNSGGDWKAVVEGGENRSVIISWETLAGSPGAVLIDIDGGRTIDMQRQSSYSFIRSDLSPRGFIIRTR
jgi:hypothetical protein